MPSCLKEPDFSVMNSSFYSSFFIFNSPVFLSYRCDLKGNIESPICV